MLGNGAKKPHVGWSFVHFTITITFILGAFRNFRAGS
jgi:hypothetical protein